MLLSVQTGLSGDYSAAHLHAFERPSFVLFFKNCSGQKMCCSQSVERLYFCLLGKTCDNNEKCSDLNVCVCVCVCVCGVEWRTLGDRKLFAAFLESNERRNI